MTHCRRVASESILSRRNQRVLLCRSASYTLGEKRCERRPVCDFSRWSSSGFLKGRWHRAAATSLTSVSLDILFFCWMIGCFFDTKGFQTNLNSSKKKYIAIRAQNVNFPFSLMIQIRISSTLSRIPVLRRPWKKCCFLLHIDPSE